MGYIYTLIKATPLLLVGLLFAQKILNYLNKSPNRVAILMLWLIGIAPIISELGTDRAIGNKSNLTIIPAPIPILSNFNFYHYIFLVVIFMNILIFMYVAKRRVHIFKGTSENRNIWRGYLLYNFTLFLACIFGTKPYFSFNIFISFVILSGLIFIIDYRSLDKLIKHIIYILLVYIYISLILGIMFPDWATTYYNNVLPLFNTRLSGIMSQSNGLGPIPVLYFIFRMTVPRGNQFINVLNTTAALLVIVWSESKTSIVIFLLIIVIVLVSKFQKNSSSRFFISLSITSLFSIFFIFFIVSLFNYNGIIYNIFNEINILYDKFSTLTGRFVIWEITLKTWSENILFGYGPDIWGLEFRTFYNMEYVGAAHNQFVQTLGESGLLGFIGLIIFIFILLFYSVKFFNKTNGASLMFVVFILVRSITETPFRNFGLTIHLFSLISILIYLSFINAYKIKNDHK